MLPSRGSDRRRITSDTGRTTSRTSPSGRAAETRTEGRSPLARSQGRYDEHVGDDHAAPEQHRHRVQREAESLGLRGHGTGELQQSDEDERVEGQEEYVGPRWRRHAAEDDLIQGRRDAAQEEDDQTGGDDEPGPAPSTRLSQRRSDEQGRRQHDQRFEGEAVQQGFVAEPAPSRDARDDAEDTDDVGGDQQHALTVPGPAAVQSASRIPRGSLRYRHPLSFADSMRSPTRAVLRALCRHAAEKP